jgi:hypothetical protein
MMEFEGYGTVAEIEEVVRRFESCEYQPEEFFHARHLTVAAWYFAHFDVKTAEERMRSGLMKFIRHHGKNGYHVTITEFWLRMVERTLRETGRGEELLSRVNRVIRQLNHKGLIYEYFRREKVDSPEAKAGWIEPDLKKLPGAV